MVEKMNKEAKHVLDQSLQVLTQAMNLAVEKDDLDAMIGISDRLMMLYQHLADKNVKKFKPGFSLNAKEEEVRDSDSD
jgi:hypothetical protein